MQQNTKIGEKILRMKKKKNKQQKLLFRFLFVKLFRSATSLHEVRDEQKKKHTPNKIYLHRDTLIYFYILKVCVLLYKGVSFYLFFNVKMFFIKLNELS